MAGTLQDSDIVDLITAATRNLQKGRFSQIAQELQDYVTMRLMLTKDRMTFDHGWGINYTIMDKLANSAKHVSMFDEDETSVKSLLANIQIPWVHAQTHYAFERRELLMNRGDARIINHIKTRRAGAHIDMAAELESKTWSLRSSGDTELPNGIPYYVVKNTTQGFNGGTPSGHTTVAGLTITDHPNYQNWTDDYTNISKTDLIAKMRKAHRECLYRSPVTLDDFRGPMGRRYRLYVNGTTVDEMAIIAEQQNDQLGRDIASMDGQTVFKKIPFNWVPELDSDTENPVYGIDITSFFPVVLAGDYLRESAPTKAAKQHNVFEVFVDLSYNFLCIDRRRNFVIHNPA